MDHNEAVQSMIAEKYLLNELSPDVREQFEEHYFGCTDCANDLRAVAMFIEKSKIVLAERPALVTAKAPHREEGRAGWLAWLRPVFAVPVMAVLLGVIAYQNLGQHPQPKILASALINVGSRGLNIPVRIHQDEGFLLLVNFPPEQQYSSYTAELRDPAGKTEWSIRITPEAERTSYPIQVPAKRRMPGIYTLAIRGAMGSGQSSSIGESPFELQIEK
jgi:hypothetical protein